MEKQILEILAKVPEISQVGIAYVEYLRLKLFMGFGLIACIVVGVGIAIRAIIKTDA